MEIIIVLILMYWLARRVERGYYWKWRRADNEVELKDEIIIEKMLEIDSLKTILKEYEHTLGENQAEDVLSEVLETLKKKRLDDGS